jgi:hypothetical protein
VETTGIPTPVGADVEAALFRVAQRPLANVAKHAGASEVHLTLSYLDDMLLLDVADDGVGFAPVDGTDGTEGPNRAGGYGLPGMRRRVERLSGRLTLESIPCRPGPHPRPRPGVWGGAMSPIRRLIVDDHPVMRDGLRGVFAGDSGFEVVGEAGDGAEAVRQASSVSGTALRPWLSLMNAGCSVRTDCGGSATVPERRRRFRHVHGLDAEVGGRKTRSRESALPPLVGRLATSGSSGGQLLNGHADAGPSQGRA